MSPLWPATAFLVAAVASAWGTMKGLRDPELTRPNHAGRPVPVALGKPLAGGAQMGTLVALGLAALPGRGRGWPAPLLGPAAGGALAAAGPPHDRRGSGPRGLAAHVTSLLRGRPTTGILKLAVGGAAAIVLAVVLEDGALLVGVSALVIALAVNVTNALDVRPGRALKWALAILLPVTAAAWGHGVVLATAASVAACLAVLGFDLRERGMLGDAGSNPLGLVVGVGLAAVLPAGGLVAAAAILGGLQVAAETVTISRIIDATPPVRWLDRLGRRS